jgi:arylsulfatase
MKPKLINYGLLLLIAVGAIFSAIAPAYAMTFKDYPPRSIPPSFNPATIMDQTIKGIETKRKLENAFPMLKEEAAK